MGFNSIKLSQGGAYKLANTSLQFLMWRIHVLMLFCGINSHRCSDVFARINSKSNGSKTSTHTASVGYLVVSLFTNLKITNLITLFRSKCGFNISTMMKVLPLRKVIAQLSLSPFSIYYSNTDSHDQ